MLTDHIKQNTANTLRDCAGLSLWEFYLRPPLPEMTRTMMVKLRMDEINAKLGTDYKNRHINGFIRGAKPTTKEIQKIMRLHFLLYLLGDEAGQIVFDVLHRET